MEAAGSLSHTEREGCEVDPEEEELQKREQDRLDREATQARYKARLKAEAAEAARQAKLWAAAQQQQQRANSVDRSRGGTAAGLQPPGPSAPEPGEGLLARLTQDWHRQAVQRSLKPIRTSSPHPVVSAHGVFHEPPIIPLPILDAAHEDKRLPIPDLLPTPEQPSEQARHAHWLHHLRTSSEEGSLASSPASSHDTAPLTGSEEGRSGSIDGARQTQAVSRALFPPSNNDSPAEQPDPLQHADDPVCLNAAPLPAPAPQTIGWVFGGDLSQIPPPPRHSPSGQARPRPQRDAQSLPNAASPIQGCANPNELRSVSLASWIPRQPILAQAGDASVASQAATPESRGCPSPVAATYLQQAFCHQRRAYIRRRPAAAEGFNKPQVAAADESLHCPSLASWVDSAGVQDQHGMSPSLLMVQSGADIRTRLLQQVPTQQEALGVQLMRAEPAPRWRAAQEALAQDVPRPRRAAPRPPASISEAVEDKLPWTTPVNQPTVPRRPFSDANSATPFSTASMGRIGHLVHASRAESGRLDAMERGVAADRSQSADIDQLSLCDLDLQDEQPAASAWDQDEHAPSAAAGSVDDPVVRAPRQPVRQLQLVPMLSSESATLPAAQAGPQATANPDLTGRPPLIRRVSAPGTECFAAASRSGAGKLGRCAVPGPAARQAGLLASPFGQENVAFEGDDVAILLDAHDRTRNALISPPPHNMRPSFVSRARAFLRGRSASRKGPAGDVDAGAPGLAATRSCDIDLLY